MPSASVKDLLLAPGLPQNSTMESLNVLQKWFLERGNKIASPSADQAVQESVDSTTIRTADFEEPDQTPGLVIQISSAKNLDAHVDTAKKSKGLNEQDAAQLLYRFVRNLQKHQGLVTLALSVDSKRNYLECKKIDIPLAIQTAYQFAGLSRPVATSGYLVSCVVPSVLSPLLDVVNHVCPAILAGCNVVILADPKSARTVAVITDILLQSGCPPDSLHFLPMATIPNTVDGISFLQICEITDNIDPALKEQDHILYAARKLRSTAIITDSADLESAVASVLDAVVFARGLSAFCPSKVLVQETVMDRVMTALRAKLATLRCGAHLDKSADYASVISMTDAQTNAAIIVAAKKEGTEFVYHSSATKHGTNFLYPVLVATNVAPTSSLLGGKYIGPLLALIPFRTIKEAVALANNGRFGASCSVWSENTAASMEIARNVKAGTVWINAHHLFDAAVGSGGSGASGWPVVGKDVLYDFSSPGLPLTGSGDEKDSGDPSTSSVTASRTYKMFYGGGQKRPESGLSLTVKLSKRDETVQIPEGGAKDLKNAVDAAAAAAAVWAKSAPFTRSQILFYVAENLSGRLTDFTNVLEPFYKSREDAQAEVSDAVNALFFWAGQAVKSSGEVILPNSSWSVLHLREPLGVIAAVLPETRPLLSFINALGAALAFGNAIVAVPSLQSAVVALEFCQVLETSDVPPGVVNVVTGRSDALLGLLAQHSGLVAAVWDHSGDSSEAAQTAWKGVLASSLDSQQLLWKVVDGKDAVVQWENVARMENTDLFRRHATQHKRIWLSSSESFAN